MPSILRDLSFIYALTYDQIFRAIKVPTWKQGGNEQPQQFHLSRCLDKAQVGGLLSTADLVYCTARKAHRGMNKAHAKKVSSSASLANMLLAVSRLGLPRRASDFKGRHVGLVPLMNEPPQDPAVIVPEIVKSIADAWSKGYRRLEITLPKGLVIYKKEGMQTLGSPEISIPEEYTEKGNRDCAFVCSNVFRSLGDKVAVIVPPEQESIARMEWEEGGLETRIITSPSEMDPKGFSNKGGVPKIVVIQGANKNLLTQVESIVAPFGDEVAIILANPQRLKSGKGRKGFEATYVLRENPHPEWWGGILYRRFPENWSLSVNGEKGKIAQCGDEQETRPTLDEIEAGFSDMLEEQKDTLGDVWSAGFRNVWGVGKLALKRRVPDVPPPPVPPPPPP